MIDGIAKGLTRSGPFVSSVVVTVLERLDPADSRRDRGADVVGLRADVECRILLRLIGGGEDQVHETIDAPSFLVLDPLRGVEVLDLAGEVDLVVRVVELLDLARARLAGEQTLPGRLDVVAERRDRAHPRDDDSAPSVMRPVAHLYIPSPPSTSSTSPVMNEASSEQRKRTAPATSAGSPRRPSGVFSSIAAVASSGSTSVSCVFT